MQYEVHTSPIDWPEIRKWNLIKPLHLNEIEHVYIFTYKIGTGFSMSTNITFQFENKNYNKASY